MAVRGRNPLMLPFRPSWLLKLGSGCQTEPRLDFPGWTWLGWGRIERRHRRRQFSYRFWYPLNRLFTKHQRDRVPVTIKGAGQPNKNKQQLNYNSPLPSPIKVYSPPCAAQNTLTLDNYNNLIKPNHNLILVGDFNCHNTLWWSPKTDPQGNILDGFLNNNNLVCLNDGSIIYIYIYIYIYIR